MIRKLRPLLIVAAAFVAVLALPSNSYAACSSASSIKYAYVWEHSYCGGMNILRTPTNKDVGNLNNWNMNDKISSVQCGTLCGKVRLYNDINYCCFIYEVPNTSNKATIGTWNDKASSLKTFWL